MLAAATRRSAWVQGGPATQAAASQALADLLRGLQGTDHASAASGHDASCTGRAAQASAAAAAARPLHTAAAIAAWPWSTRPFSSSAASCLAASPRSGDEQQQQKQQQQQQQHEQSCAADGSSGSSSRSGAAVEPPASQRPRIVTGTWLDRLPHSWIPYAQLARIEKPIGTWLLAWPCFWSIGLAAPPGALPDAHLLALFGAGAVLLRGAGCTINDLWDRELDKQVERTRGRPLAAGTVTVPQAVAFLGAQLAAGLAILLQLNPYSQALGASSLALVAAYPAMKRITGWPQAFLGLTFNWGALLGWAAAHGACDWAAVAPLYASGVCWTLVYDTIYAHQDKRDDARVGIRSTALTFGPRTKAYCSGFGAASVALLTAAGHAAGCGPAFYAGAAGAAAHLAWQIRTVDLDSGADCHAKFVSNAWYGALPFAGILADRLLQLA